jgi:hypothetical protein
LRSRKTVAKYQGLEKLPSEIKQPRRHRTRPDRSEANWSAAAQMLEEALTLEAKALFEWLCEQHSGTYQPGRLRTFQRRLSTWRALRHEKVAILEQVHRPGETIQTTARG